MDKLGVGVIGCGSIAQLSHFASIDELPETELIATCDRDEKRAEEMAKKWKAKGKWYKDYRKMLEKEKMDIVIIATPQSYHHEQAIAAAEKGIHLFVEKPMTCTNKEAWEIVEAAEKAKVKLMVGCNQRFWPQHQIGKELIEKGVIGDIKMGRSSLHESWKLFPERLSFTDFRRRADEGASAALLEVAVHRIDLIRWLIGSEVKRVVGIAKRIASPEEYTLLDDAMWMIMEFENGSISAVSSDRFSPAVSNITEIYGTEGTMFLSSEATNPFQSVPLAIYSNKDYTWDELPDVMRKWFYPQTFWPDDFLAKPVPKRWISISPPREWSYSKMLKYFIECIQEDKEPELTSGRDGAKVIEIICAVFKSMETNSWVDLPLKEEVVPPQYKPYYGRETKME